MNKLRYRIVFNKTRGMLMAVQETARSHGGGAGVTGKLDDTVPTAMALPALRRIALMLGAPFGGMLIAGAAFAQIVADPNAPGNQRATVLEAANGVPQVDIQTPSAAGVSRNVFMQFDVGADGVILNNSRTAVQTQLGGWVQGNPWLATGGARVILNEINSSNPSQLKGYIEVAGQRAETVIANPAGIVVDGGGFINVSRATLTTGSPLMNGDGLSGYSVQRGRIVVEGAGLDASRTDYTALIARSVQLNAGVWAQKLNVIGGANEVAEDGMARQAAVPENGAETAPVYAIDVARLGGMYANHIYLVGTEAGVGVRNAGTIGAAAGDLIVTSGGRLENSGSLAASGRVQAKAGVVDNTGQMSAGTDLLLTAGSLRNTGTFSATGDAAISIVSDADNRAGSIEARRLDIEVGSTLLNDHGRIVQSGTSTLAIDAARVVNAGELGRENLPVPAPGAPAGGDMGGESASPVAGNDAGTPVGGAPTIPEDGSVSTPPPDGRIKAKRVDNGSGLVTANNGIVVRTGELDNRGGKASLNSLAVHGASLDNTSGVLSVRGDLAASTNSFVNRQGKVVVGGRFDGIHGVLSNSQGLLQAGLLALDVDSQFDNEAGTVRQTGGATANLNIGGELSQDGGTLDMASGLVLNTGGLSGTGGVLNINGDLVLKSGATSARGGTWTIGANARLRTGDLDSRDGSIAVGGTLALSAATLDNAAGKISSEGNSSIAASGTLSNSAGHIRSGGDLGVTAGGMLANDAGKIESTGSAAELHVGAATIANGSGSIVNAGSGATVLTAETVTSRGIVGGNGVLEISAYKLVNEAQGRIIAAGDVKLGVSADLANAGSIASEGNLALMQSSAHLLNQGDIVSQGDLFIVSNVIDNIGGTIATATGSNSALLLQTGSLRNDGGTLQSDANVRLDIGGHISNQGGRIQSGQNLSLATGGSLENRGGAIEAAGKLDLRAADVRNAGGSILGVGTGQTVLNIANGIDSDGQIGANGDLRILAGTLDNGAAGSISTTGELVFDVRDSVTNRGVIGSAGKLDFDQDQASLVNTGTITSGEAVQVKLDRVDNEGGTIETRNGATMTLTANALHNRNGQIAASGAARIAVSTVLDNTAGGLQASGALDVSAGGALHNQGGSIELGGAQAILAVQAASIDSTAGRIVNAGTGSTTLTAESHIVMSGLVASNGGLSLSGRTLNNAGTVSAADSLELAVSEVIDNAGTLSAATQVHVGGTNVLLRNSGTIVAGSLVDISARTIDNADGRIATAAGSGADILLNANALDNRGGDIMADRDATLQVRNVTDNTGGLVQANGRLGLTSGGVVDNTGGVIETLAEASALAVHAEALRNAGGRVVNAGRGDTTLIATSVDNGGVIGGNGRLVLEADTGTNAAGATITAGAELRLQVYEHLANAGSISSSGTLAMDESGARLTNSGSIVSGADASIRAGTIENDGGTIATASRSSASISLGGANLSNRDGRIVADDAMLLAVDGPLDNTGGVIQGVSSVQVDSGAALDNDNGLIEATGAQATLAVSAETVDNGTGRIVNVGEGAASVSATTGIANSGLIAGNGRLNLAGARLENAAGGTIASADAMTVAIHDVLENRGAINSSSSLDLAAAGAAVRNSGLIVAGGPLTLRAQNFNNDEGQLASASGSGADVTIAAGAVSNRAGVIQASGELALASGSSVNNVRGTMQAASSLALEAVGEVLNDDGVIESLEAAGTLQLQAAALDNGSGRIVNVGKGATNIALTGTLASNGLIAGNGTLAVSAAEVDNHPAGTLSSGGTMTLTAADRIANAGAISSGAALSLGAVTLRNSGRVTGTGDIIVSATALDNSGGQLATVNDSDGAIIVEAGALANLGGTILADGAVRLSTAGVLANGGGTIRAGESMSIDAGGSLGNQGGSIEAAASNATLALTAQAIDNRGGRLVNVGTGDTRIRSATEVLNSGTLAGNGRVELDAAALSNLIEGSLAAGGPMEFRVTQQFDNAGAISSAGALTLDQAGTSIANSGDITAAGRITLHGSSIDNDGGEIATQFGADIVLNSLSSLSNNGGIVAATGNAVLNAQGTVDNGDGLVQTAGHLELTAAGALTNAGGRLEAVGLTSTLELAVESIDNGGRIVNAGTGTTNIEAVNAIANSGTIAGSGTFDLHATTLHNAANGSIVSGGPLVLALRESFDNHGGTISSTGTLRFDGLGASFTNSGRIGAGGLMDIAALNTNNDGGRLYTASGSDAAITLQAGDLSNRGGTIAADGSFALRTSGDILNDGGTLHGSRDFTLDAGGGLITGQVSSRLERVRSMYGRNRSKTAGVS